jgi:hypothetical protein
MALTLTPIDPDDSIFNGPDQINQNFQLVQNLLNEFETRIVLSGNKIRLTNVATIPDDSFEGSSITLTKTSGNVIVIAPNGGASTYNVTFDGRVTALNITASGTGSDKSIIEELQVNLDLQIGRNLVVAEDLDLRGANSIIRTKIEIKQITSNSIGASATTPLDISKGQHILLDCENGSVDLVVNPDEPIIKIDTTLLKENQVTRIQLFKDNPSGVKFYNGTLGNEVFAIINSFGGSQGYLSITDTVYPTFDIGANKRCWMDVQWVQISAGVFRLVVLDSENVLNVN